MKYSFREVCYSLRIKFILLMGNALTCFLFYYLIASEYGVSEFIVYVIMVIATGVHLYETITWFARYLSILTIRRGMFPRFKAIPHSARVFISGTDGALLKWAKGNDTMKKFDVEIPALRDTNGIIHGAIGVGNHNDINEYLSFVGIRNVSRLRSVGYITNTGHFAGHFVQNAPCHW